jgi:acyl carrier protein
MSRSQQQIADELRVYIVEKHRPGDDPAGLADDLPLRAASVLDSMSLLDVINHVEKRYGIFVDPYEAVSQFERVAKIASLIVTKKAA